MSAVSLAVLLLISGRGAARAARRARAPGRVTISVVGTNDLHGHLESLPRFGGFLANLRRAREGDGGGVVLVDAGDMFQGTLESNLGEGAAVVRAYGALHYDAVAIGNHEFDFGPVGPASVPRTSAQDPRGALRARAAEARFPFLAANLVEKATGAPPRWRNVRPTTMLEVAGVKIGVVGATTVTTGSATLAADFAGLATTPLAAAITNAAQRLRRRGATVVIVAAHAGGTCRTPGPPDDLSSCEPDSEIFQLARALPAGAIDVIVAGHTHEGFARRVAGIPIIESFSNGRAFGRVDLTIDRSRGTVVSADILLPRELHDAAKPGLESYEGALLAPDAAIGRSIAPALAAARTKREQPLDVEVAAPIPRAHKIESPLGNLFADLMRAARSNADVAIVNGGSLRADLPAGPLTYGRLFEAIPFDNSFATVPVKGAELADIIARNLGRDNGIVSISGLRASARCVGPSLVVTLTRPDGRPVAPAERLTLITSNFLATGGDGLLSEVAARPTIDEGELIRDAMADLLRARKGALRPDDPGLYDPAHPRLDYPGPRPVRCGVTSRQRPHLPL